MNRDYLLLTIFLSILLSFGFAFIYSAGIPMEVKLIGFDATDNVLRQIFSLILGALVAIFIILLRGTTHFKLSFKLYYPAILVLLAAVFIFPSRGGSHRWIDLGFINFQPSELAKIIIILLLAKYYGNLKKEHEGNFIKTVLIPVLLVLPMIGLVALETDLSTALVLLMITFIMMVLGEVKFLYLFMIVGLVIVVFIVAVFGGFLEDYQVERLLSFISGFEGEAHEQVELSISAFPSGGLLGTGPSKGIIKYSLPVTYSDFIFATIGEELGLVGVFILMFAYIGLTRTLIVIATKRCKNRDGKLYIVGFSLFILLQASIHIAVNLGLFPPTGITLPFVSYGGSSIISLTIGFGFVFSILFENKKEEEENDGESSEKTIEEDK
jgi:cell division protein FtsW